MTSEERHAARRARREAKRREKRMRDLAPYDNFETVADLNHLIDAARLSSRGVGRKASVQKYNMNLAWNVQETREKLLAGVDIRQGFIEFDLHERGKARHIKSMHFKERVVQRCICDRALVPILSRSLVYDNGASLAGKGIHFAIYRLRGMLQRYWREHGNWNGYVLLVDFSKYFDNIRHEPVHDILWRSISDERLRDLAWKFVEAFGDVGIGIGSQVSQILAVAYADRADHALKEIYRLGKSIRYMDDTIVISDSKERLQEALDGIMRIWSDLGIVVHKTKTQIIPMRRFTFLKVRFCLTDTGKVVMKPCRASFSRMRRKLRSFHKFWKRGEMTMEQIHAAYISWYGFQSHMHAHKALRSANRYYNSLFGGAYVGLHG